MHYDPMIGKLIAKGPDRATALANLHAGLSELQVSSRASVLLLLCDRSLCLAPFNPPALMSAAVSVLRRMCLIY